MKTITIPTSVSEITALLPSPTSTKRSVLKALLRGCSSTARVANALGDKVSDMAVSDILKEGESK